MKDMGNNELAREPIELPAHHNPLKVEPKWVQHNIEEDDE
jgi:hypothetical protein